MVKKSGAKAEIETLARDKQNHLHKGRYQEVAETCNYLGELLMREERYEDAISEHETELEMCVKTKDDLGKAIANRKIGECYCAMGDYEKALRFQQKHLTIARELNSDIEQQRAHATIGRTYMCRAEGTDDLRVSLRKAKEAFNSSLDFAVILKDGMDKVEYSLMVGRLYLNLGILAEMGGNMTQAVKYLKESDSMMKDGKHQEEELKCVNMLASIFSTLGDLDAAQDHASTAYSMAKQLKNKTAVAEVLIIRAGIAMESERFLESRHCLKKVLKMKPPCKEFRSKAKKMMNVVAKLKASLQRLKTAPDVGDEQMKVLDSLADDYCSVECYYSALRFYKRMLEVAKEIGKSSSELATIYVSLAQTSVDLKNYSEAIRYAREEIKLRDDPAQRCRTWINIADYMDKKDDSESSKIAAIYDRAIAEAERSGKQRLLIRCLRYQQLTYQSMGDLEKAGDLGDRIRLIGEVEEAKSDVESDAGGSRASSPDSEDLSSLTETDEEEGGGEDKPLTLARRGQFTKVRRNEKGETQLHVAVINGQLKRVKQLIDGGHPVNERDHCGWLSIHEAANHNHLEIATFLIEHNAWLNDRGLKGCNGLTPILDAAYSGNLEMVRLLLDRGAVVTCRDGDGKTVVDALMAWRKENFLDARDNMDAAAQAAFDDLIGTLQAAMIQGGMRPEDLRSRPSQKQNAATARKRAPAKEDSRDGRAIFPHLDTDGAHLYQAAIDGIRGTTFRRRQEKRKRPPSPLTSAAPDSALIRPDDFTGDDWLIEDMKFGAESAVNRDVADILYTTGTRPQSGKRKPSSYATKSATKSSKSTVPIASDGDAQMDVECINITNPSRSGVDSEFISIDDDWPPNHSSGPLTSSPSVRPANTSHSPVPVPPSTVSTAGPPVTAKTMDRLRIRIEELVIIVPLTAGQDRTIGWLAEEAAIRYSDMKGIRPVLQLKTSDGAVLSALDLVRDVVAHSEEITGCAVSWHNPPMTERYAKACRAAGVPEIDNILQLLVSACESGSFAGLDLNISSGLTVTIVRCLQFQSSIRQLILEANPIGDAGFQTLLEALPSLPNITHLELAGTDLTTVSLDALKRTLTNPVTKCLQCLSNLNLSHNDFSDDAVNHLADILSELPCLSTLTLNDCGFTRNFLAQRESSFRSALAKPQRLRTLSVAYNQLEAKGSIRLLSVLPVNLKTLNLSVCLSDDQSVRQLYETGESAIPAHLESISFADCHLSPEVFPDFIRFLARFSALQSVNLSRNAALGGEQVEFLFDALESSVIKWTSLDISGIRAASQVLPVIQRTIESNSGLHELTVTVVDVFERNNLIECWKKCMGAGACLYPGMLTVQLYCP